MENDEQDYKAWKSTVLNGNALGNLSFDDIDNCTKAVRNDWASKLKQEHRNAILKKNARAKQPKQTINEEVVVAGDQAEPVTEKDPVPRSDLPMMTKENLALQVQLTKWQTISMVLAAILGGLAGVGFVQFVKMLGEGVKTVANNFS